VGLPLGAARGSLTSNTGVPHASSKAAKEQKIMQGIVRWYSAQGFGFVDPLGNTDGKALYVHISDVRDRTLLRPGDVVTFDTIQAPKGPKCVNVQVVKTKEAIICPQTA
jgi:cold shock CspA family protein